MLNKTNNLNIQRGRYISIINIKQKYDITVIKKFKSFISLYSNK